MHLEQVEEKATRSGKEMSSKRRIRSTISFGKDSIKASACLILVMQKFCEDFLNWVGVGLGGDYETWIKEIEFWS